MTQTPENTTPARPSITLRAQYIKDLSFENPRAPASLFNMKEQPQMEVAVNLGAQRLDETVFEVAIQLTVRAIAENATVFLCDLTYGGVVELQNIPAEAVEPTLFIQAAQLIYPFARRVVSDVTRDGGFPPVALEPLDFVTMYQEQRLRPPAPVAEPIANA